MADEGDFEMEKRIEKTIAEEAFRPWWDRISDFILYGLAMISMALWAQAMFATNPLECKACGEDSCPTQFRIFTNVQGDRDADWINNFCLVNAVDWLVLYFPYILITATVGLLGIEKIFLKMREGNAVQNKFFALLVGYGILHTKEKKAGREELIVGDELESDRNLANLKEKLENSCSYFWGYLAVQIMEAIFSFGCCTFLMFKLCVDTRGIGIDGVSLFCNAHGKVYDCIGNPGAFNTAVVVSVVALFLLYGLFAVYSIVWAAFPCMHPLKGFLEDEKVHLSRDFKFLLNLLCLGSGIAPAITILTILEKEVLDALRPTKTDLDARNISGLRSRALTATATTIRDNRDGISLVVEIKEPGTELMRNLKSLRKEAKVTYIAELEPKARTAIEQLRPFQVADELEPGKPRATPSHFEPSQLRATFLSLDKDTNYTVTVKTLIDGRAMCSFKKEFKTSEL